MINMQIWATITLKSQCVPGYLYTVCITKCSIKLSQVEGSGDVETSEGEMLDITGRPAEKKIKSELLQSGTTQLLKPKWLNSTSRY